MKKAASKQSSGSAAYIYILRCADGTLYTGWTTDIERRLEEHNSQDRGAKYTRARRPCVLAYSEGFPDRQSAMRREWEIKNRLSRAEKEALIAGSSD
ncbi:MAG: GIY-YIG nuclease family protein [Lachnospiraceae bacterium]|jgi:putative endonuclease|nr:GIY-YIG nuclease family protein [Lachnospiraceae bacterium]